MTDHHDFDDDRHFDDDPLPYEQPGMAEPDPLPAYDDHLAPWDDDPDTPDLPEDPAEPAVPETLAVPEPDPAPADIADLAEEPVDVFPAAVDVGALPEPVDGFPWIDSGSLGLADIAAALHEADTTEPVQPPELAEYAAADLPPGVDPWAALADSDDPATSALARWWSPN
jgi:hypothetical protein